MEAQKTETEEKILPNKTGTVEGKWYPFKGEYKITQIKPLDEEKRAYRITMTFPSDARTGIHPKEIAIQGEAKDTDYGWACFYYGMTEKEVPEEMRKMAETIKALGIKNRELRNRNNSLERHFSRTVWEREYKYDFEKQKIQACYSCGDKINLKKDIEGRDYTFIGEDGDLMHMDCAIEFFNMICPDCGTVYGESEEDVCEEDGSKLDKATKEEIKKALVYDVVKRSVPKEVQGLFKITYVQKPKSKHHPSYYTGSDKDD